MSGRYTELLPKFYVPADDRVVVNKGTKMRPLFEDDSPGAERRRRTVVFDLNTNSSESWGIYQDLLRKDVANEVARMVLPLNIYSQMYWTVNARSLMNFLSLRGTQDDRPEEIRSYPQREIQMAAEQIEMFFDEAMPATYHAFVENGRVAP